MNTTTRLVLALVCLGIGPARSAHGDTLDAYSSTLTSNSRITGLAGASVGVAEGQDGQAFNAASLAQRRRTLDRSWDWDFVFTQQTSTDVRTLDFDNDGNRDTGLVLRGAFQAGLSGQIKKVGFGVMLDSVVVNAVDAATGAELSVPILSLSMGAAYGFLDEQLLLGLELQYSNGGWQGSFVGDHSATLFEAYRFRGSVLWRPKNQFFRIGAQVDPGGEGKPETPPPELPRALWRPDSITYPLVLRVGASAWLGAGARRYNELALKTRKERGLKDEVPTGAVPPVMVSLEVDVVGPSGLGYSPTSFVSQLGGTPLLRSGKHFSVAPHLGAEWEFLPTWLVARGGSYVEPARIDGATARVHGTFGADVRIPLWLVNLRASASGDFARNYRFFALSVGFWHELGPYPEPWSYF